MTFRALAVLTLALAAPSFAADAPREPWAAWADETLGRIETQHRLRDGKPAGLYSARPRGRTPDFAWGEGVQLSALAGAARYDAKRLPFALDLVRNLDRAHWNVNADGLGGYDATAFNRAFDRYYDDNAWFALAFVELFELTGDKRHLDRCRRTLDFVLSGHDPTLGGGIWWHEQAKKSKHTCSVAPTIVALLRLDEHATDPKLRATARDLYAWLNAKLQDPADGLYWDNLVLEGEKVDERKYTYNTALMIRANVQFARITEGEERSKFTAEAARLAAACEAKWTDPETGATRDGGRFAHLLNDAWADLSDHTGDPRWRALAERAAKHAREHTRTKDGAYGERWHRPATEDRRPELIAQSSAARAFARLAWPEQGATTQPALP